jgi:hypothetical protein
LENVSFCKQTLIQRFKNAVFVENEMLNAVGFLTKTAFIITVSNTAVIAKSVNS